MKSERRHELQHNELADWLAKTAETIKPYQNIIATAVIAIVVLGVGYTFWSRESAAQTSLAWDDLNSALTSKNPTAELAKVIELRAGTQVAYTAEAVLADLYLAGGCNNLFKNKANGYEELKKAIALYDAVLSETQQPALRERATFGLARAKESRGDADSIKQAIGFYKDVVQKWPSGAYAGLAKERLDDLDRAQTMAMYDRFARFDPKPAFSPEPSAGLTSEPQEPAAAVEPSQQPAEESKPEAKPETEKPAEQPAEEAKQ